MRSRHWRCQCLCFPVLPGRRLLETERTYENFTKVHESAEHGLYLAEQVGCVQRTTCVHLAAILPFAWTAVANSSADTMCADIATRAVTSPLETWLRTVPVGCTSYGCNVAILPGLTLQVGRWLGYTTARFFALLSILNMVKTFKRVLLFKVYMKKCPLEQQQMVEELRKTDSTTARFLARVTSGKRDSLDRVDEEFVREPLPRTSSLPIGDASAPRLRLRHSASHGVTRALDPSATAASGPERQHSLSQDLSSPGFRSKGNTLPDTASSTAEPDSAFASYRSVNLTRTATFQLPPVSSGDVSRPVAIQLQPPSSAADGKIWPKSLAEDSVCMAIAQDIQRLEVRLF